MALGHSERAADAGKGRFAVSLDTTWAGTGCCHVGGAPGERGGLGNGADRPGGRDDRSVTRIMLGRTAISGAGSSTVAALAQSVVQARRVARLWATSSLLLAVLLGVGVGVEGARWLSPDDDLDARAAAFAAQFVPTARLDPPRRKPVLPPADGNRLEVAPGYYSVSGLKKGPGIWWDISIQSGAVSGDIVQVEDGSLVFAIVHPTSFVDPSAGEFRPVVFDAQQRRYLPRWERSVTCTSEFGQRASLSHFRLGRDVLPAEKIDCVLVERMKSETRRLTARNAPPVPVARDEPVSAPPEDGRYPAAVDHSWAITPRPVGNGHWTALVSGARGGVLCDVITDRRGTLRLLLAYPSRTPVDTIPDPISEFRLVFFDSLGRRYLLGGHRISMPLWDAREFDDIDRIFQSGIMERINDPVGGDRHDFSCPDHPDEVVFVRDPVLPLPHPVIAFNAWGNRRRVESKVWGTPRSDPADAHLADIAVYHCGNPGYATLAGESGESSREPVRLEAVGKIALIGVERMSARAFHRSRIEALNEWFQQQRRTRERRSAHNPPGNPERERSGGSLVANSELSQPHRFPPLPDEPGSDPRLEY